MKYNLTRSTIGISAAFIIVLSALCFFLLPGRQVSASAGNDIQGLRNKDFGVGAYGLYFHSSVPQRFRKELIDDLTWLDGFGELEGSEKLSEFLGLDGQRIAGRDIVAWILERLQVIGSMEYCPTQSTVVISNANLALGPLVFEGLRKPCDNKGGPIGEAMNLLIGDHHWRAADENNGEIDALAVDDRLLLVPISRPGPIPAIMLDIHALDDSSQSAFANRVQRLLTLVHEVVHLGFHGHQDCSAGSLYMNNVVIGRLKGSSKNYSKQACDRNDFANAYAASGLLLSILAHNCPTCSADETRSMEWGAAVELFHVEVKLRQPQVLGIQDQAGATGLSRLTLTSVPPRLFFDTVNDYELSREASEPASKVPSRRKGLAKIIAKLEKLEASGSFIGAWSALDGTVNRHDTVDRDAAGAWLKAAVKAEGTGYNVPTTWIINCDQFANGCKPDR